MSRGVPDNWSWADAPRDGGPSVVVDVDGVVTDAWHRQHFLDRRPRDWRSFFEASGDDPPVDSVAVMLELLSVDASIVLLTARPHYVAPMTLDWLRHHGTRWDLLIMRGAVDGGLRSAEFKRRSVAELRARDFEIVLAFDDDLRNIEMFHAEDVPAIYIHSGYYG